MMDSRLWTVCLCLVVVSTAFAGGFGTVAIFTDSEVVDGTVTTADPSEEDAVSQYENESDAGNESDSENGSDTASGPETASIGGELDALEGATSEEEVNGTDTGNDTSPKASG